MKSGPWIQTFTGRKVHPFDPDPASLHIEDIAHALSNLCRFSGHVRRFYSVAQHSVHAARYVSERAARRHALLHDAAEAYFNDLAHPIKHATGLEVYVHAERTMRGVIFERFGLAREMPAAVREVDARLLWTERDQLMAPMIDDDEGWGHGVQLETKLPFTIPSLSPLVAKGEFLTLFYELFEGVSA